MKSYLKHVLITVTMSCFATLAHAGLKISNAWVKPTVAGQPVAGAYMTLTSDKDIEIIEVFSPVAGKAEMHSMTMEGNIMRMKRLDGLQVKAGRQVELKPGGFHIMLMELNHQIKEGETIVISLVSQDKSGNKVTVAIKAIAAWPKTAAPSSDTHMHH